MYELIGIISSHNSHCTSTLHSTGLPHSTNGLGSNVKWSRGWIDMMLILSAVIFFNVLLCFNSDPSVGTTPYACKSLTTSTELVASTMVLKYQVFQLHMQHVWIHGLYHLCCFYLCHTMIPLYSYWN